MYNDDNYAALYVSIIRGCCPEIAIFLVKRHTIKPAVECYTISAYALREIGWSHDEIKQYLRWEGNEQWSYL